MSRIRHIVIVAPENSTLLDVSGPLDVFTKAVEFYDSIRNKVSFSYQIHVVSMKRNRTVLMSSGISIITECQYSAIDYEIDTLIIAGLPKLSFITMNKPFLKWLNKQAQKVRRICSVCSGAFYLAESGVLDGKKATTHWSLCKQLKEQYRQIEVDINPIFIKDGNIYTSAGITAGMDLALALIEEDLGRSFALEIAKQMVLFLKRPGNQSQYSTTLEIQNIDYKPIEEIAHWISEHLMEDLAVEKLAEKALMSSRNFSRVFARELKITPARYVEKMRLQAACRFLEETKLTIDEIAELCGLSSSDSLRRLFIKNFNTIPSQYRNCFKD